MNKSSEIYGNLVPTVFLAAEVPCKKSGLVPCLILATFQSTSGNPKNFNFTPKDHLELGSQLGGIDMESGVKITGARFAVLNGDLARLQRSLINFMIDIHTKEHSYEEVYVPYVVNSESLFGTGQLPKFEEDLFKLQGKENFYLASTAEVPVTNLFRDEILDSKDLPAKFDCHTPCCRREAGSY